MQPTELQVQLSLQALRRAALERSRGAPMRELDLPDGLLDLLRDVPPIRLERMADAKMRLVAGRIPSDEDLASRVVGRLVCDRLR